MAAYKKTRYSLENIDIFYRVVSNGDILEFPRGYYSHFGVYVGFYKGIKHCVVHHTVSEDTDDYQLFKISASLKGLENSSCKKEIMQAGYLIEKVRGESHGEIRIDSVEEIMRLGGVVIINNSMDKKWQPKEGVDGRAVTTYENRHCHPPYNLRGNNCEHLVNNIRYGEHCSKQVDEVETTLAVGAGVLLGAAAIGGLAYWLSQSTKDEEKEKEKMRRY